MSCYKRGGYCNHDTSKMRYQGARETRVYTEYFFCSDCRCRVWYVTRPSWTAKEIGGWPRGPGYIDNLARKFRP